MQAARTEPFDERAADERGRLLAELGRQGIGIGLADVAQWVDRVKAAAGSLSGP